MNLDKNLDWLAVREKEMEKIWKRVKTIEWKQLIPNFDSQEASWDLGEVNYQFLFLGEGAHFLRFGEEVDGGKNFHVIYGEFWDELEEGDDRDTYVECGNKKYPAGVNNFEKWFYTFGEALTFIESLNIKLDKESVYRPPNWKKKT